jgi:tetratricopeptide (TPR) repeat protein
VPVSRRGLTALLLGLILAGFAFPLSAQRRNADREAAAISQNPGPVAGSRAEAEAFAAIQNSTDAAARLSAADKFVDAYPRSQLIGILNRLRMDAFMSLAQYKEAIAAGEAGLTQETQYVENLIKRADADAANPGPRDRDAPAPIDKNAAGFKAFVAELPNTQFYYWQRLMKAAQQLNDDAKALAFAEKAYALRPDDLLTLLTIAQVSSDGQHAEEMARKAVAQVTALISSPAAAGMPPSQRADLLSSVHSTLGRLYLNQKKYAESQKSYLAAIAAKNDDPALYLALGVAFAKQSPPKFNEAMNAFAKSIYLKGSTEAQAREYLQVIYQQEKKSLEGLDQFIQMAGSDLGR